MTNPRPWAEEHGIPLVSAEEIPPSDDFRDNPCLDFGRLVRRVPAFVLRPDTVDQLAECLRHLATEGLPYKLRGAAHSSGGEVLSADVVISTVPPSVVSLLLTCAFGLLMAPLVGEAQPSIQQGSPVSWETLRCLSHRLRNVHEMFHALRTHPPAFAGFLRASV